ncbi:MAG: hypothetical protein KBC73_02340 [Burkholderiaceae bacterium]|nr:hypothetical protein [Burkholderiaceae bacterium]
MRQAAWPQIFASVTGYWWALSGAFAFLALAVAMTLHWSNRGVFDQHDVLFDTDTKSRLGCYANGWVGHGRNTVHPNLCNLVNPPIRGLAILVSDGPDRRTVRERLALWVSPLAGAASLFLLMMAAARWGAGRHQQVLLGLTLAASFTTLLFASVPDHFALGGLTLAIALLLFTDRLAGGAPRLWAWTIAGWFAASITLTNLLPLVALFFLANLRQLGAWRATTRALVLGAFAVVTAFGSAVVLNLGYDIHGLDIFMPHHGTGPRKAEPLMELVRFPLQVLQSFAPSGYEIVPNALSLREPHHYRIQLDFLGHHVPGPAGWLLALVLVPCMALRWRTNVQERTMVIGLAAAVFFHGFLHARIGNDYFLYSFHWAAPLVLMLMLPERVSASVPGVRLLHLGLMVLLVIGLALNSARMLRAIDRDLGERWMPLTEHAGAR